jgi:hypothetical protein
MDEGGACMHTCEAVGGRGAQGEGRTRCSLAPVPYGADEIRYLCTQIYTYVYPSEKYKSLT